MNINDHLLKREIADFDFNDKIDLFAKAKEIRGKWNARSAIGILIYNSEYLRNRKLASDTSSQTDFYSINSVKDNLMQSIKETLIPEIDVSLVNKRNNISPTQDILELELNYNVDKERVVRDMLQILIGLKFQGFGSGRVYWEDDTADSEWWTGNPKHKPIDPQKLWYISVDNREDKRDIVEYFHREQYTIQKFKQKYPEYYKQYEDKIATMTKEDLEGNYYYNMGIVNVIVNQYERKFKVKERAIANEEQESMDMIYVSESEYEEYLKEKGATPNNMDLYKKTGEMVETTPVFDEQIRASIPIDRTETRWFQTIFVPELNILLEEPELVGNDTDYCVLPGEWNPNDIYPTAIAYDYKELLKVSGILLTTMVLNTVRIQKPIPIIVEGALKNESNFIKNYHKLGVIAKVDSEWANKNQGVNPVKWLAPPAAGAMQSMLYQMIERLLDKSMATPNVSKGIPEYAGQSGKSVELLQAQSKVSIKPDFYAVEEYLRKICEKMKVMIAEKRNYPHQLFLSKQNHIEGLTTLSGNQAIADVNTNASNQLIDVVDKCYVRVSIESNIESKNQIKDINYEKLYRGQDIPFDEFVMNQSWIDNPEDLIEAHKRATSDRAIAEMINANPQLKQQIMQMIQANPEMQSQEPQKTEQESV